MLFYQNQPPSVCSERWQSVRVVVIKMREDQIDDIINIDIYIIYYICDCAC